MACQPAERLLRIDEHVLVAHHVERAVRHPRPAMDVLAPRPVNFVNTSFASLGFDIVFAHLLDRLVDRLTPVVSIGNRDVERVADEVNRARGHREIDGGIAAVHHHGVVGLDENDAFHVLRNELVHLVADRCDLLALIVRGLEPEEPLVVALVQLPGREPVHVVDVLLLVLALLNLD